MGCLLPIVFAFHLYQAKIKIFDQDRAHGSSLQFFDALFKMLRALSYCNDLQKKNVNFKCYGVLHPCVVIPDGRLHRGICLFFCHPFHNTLRSY
jgi:hypothetical protein